MISTQDLEKQLDALDEAIASGALRVKYSDKEIEYRSVNEMMQARNLILRRLGRPAANRVYPSHSKGF